MTAEWHRKQLKTRQMDGYLRRKWRGHFAGSVRLLSKKLRRQISPLASLGRDDNVPHRHPEHQPRDLLK